MSIDKLPDESSTRDKWWTYWFTTSNWFQSDKGNHYIRWLHSGTQRVCTIYQYGPTWTFALRDPCREIWSYGPAGFACEEDAQLKAFEYVMDIVFGTERKQLHDPSILPNQKSSLTSTV